MNNKNDLDPEIAARLASLKQVPDRNPQQALEGKKAFLKQAASIAWTVSKSEIRRHSNQNNKQSDLARNHRKELRPMFSTLTSIILAISLLLGGGGVTVAAAQSSNPGDMLYDVKLLSEDALLALTTNPNSQVNLSIDLVERRFEEIAALFETGTDPSLAEIDRLRQQIEETIVLALKLPDDKAVLAFEQLQTRLQVEDQQMSQIKTNGSETAIQALIQTHAMIQERIQLLETGQMNLLQVKEQFQSMDQTKTQGQTSEPPVESTTADQGNQPDMTPQNADNGNPQDNGNGPSTGTENDNGAAGPDNGNSDGNNSSNSPNDPFDPSSGAYGADGDNGGGMGTGGSNSYPSGPSTLHTKTPTPQAGNFGRTGGTSGGR